MQEFWVNVSDSGQNLLYHTIQKHHGLQRATCCQSIFYILADHENCLPLHEDLVQWPSEILRRWWVGGQKRVWSTGQRQLCQAEPRGLPAPPPPPSAPSEHLYFHLIYIYVLKLRIIYIYIYIFFFFFLERVYWFLRAFSLTPKVKNRLCNTFFYLPKL